MDENKSGYISTPPFVTDWQSTKETGVVSDREVRDWKPLLPLGEPQYQPGGSYKIFDTQSCVSFSVAHSLEAQANFLLPSLTSVQVKTLTDAGFIVDGKFDLSARYLAYHSKTTEDGNSFQKVLDTARTVGMVPDKDWAFTKDLKSFSDWISTPPDLKKKADVWLSVFETKYDWLFWEGDSLSKMQKLSLVKESLPICPILVGRPWCPSCNPSKVKEGVPIKDCGLTRAGHATVIYEVEKDNDQKVRDTYLPYDRVFDDDYWIERAMRAVLTIREVVVDAKPTRPTVRCALGDNSPAVFAVQVALRYLGFFKANPTGYYGPITAQAVGAYQAARNISPTASGSVGPKTLAAFAADFGF